MTKTKVLYNDECPICSFEIKHYNKIATRDGLALQFDPLTDAASDWGIDPVTAAKRLHIRHNGEIIDGMPAFLILWAQIPQYQRLGRLLSLPVLRQVVRVLYDYIAAPVLYALHKRRQQRAVTRGNN